jgi:hypothetical protein
MKKLLRFFASIKFAVVIILVMAVLTSVGTIVESQYDAHIAQKLVYKTWFMSLTFALLCCSLIAVMVDRWPWKKKHAPFILAHIGIIVMVLGFVVTGYGIQFFGYQLIQPGIDGNMRIGIGDSNSSVVVPQTELQVWATFDGDQYSSIFQKEVDFFLDPPSEKPFVINTGEGPITIDGYIPFAVGSRQYTESSQPHSGAAVRFQLTNQFLNSSEWIFQRKANDKVELKLGPALVVLGPPPAQALSENAIYLTPVNKDQVAYRIYYKDSARPMRQGKLKMGDVMDTGWMGMEFKLIRLIPQAAEKWDFKELSRPTPLSTSAVRIQFKGNSYWVQLNDLVKLFSANMAYLFSYSNKRIHIGTDIKLKKFEIGKYQGTQRAMSYQSLVEVPGLGEKLISMNEPLKFNGLTFYQASFEQNEQGEPTASILSVNYDPGRFLKYLGSFLLSIGVILLFYHKRKATRKMAPAAGEI